MEMDPYTFTCKKPRSSSNLLDYSKVIYICSLKWKYNF